MSKAGERVAFSPGEFAALFGKSQTWGYRQIYAGKVKTITEYGRIQIPAAEVERILATAGRYEGMPKKPARTKEELRRAVADTANAWGAFLAKRRTSGAVKKQAAPALPPLSAKGGSLTRSDALKRLTRNSQRSK